MLKKVQRIAKMYKDGFTLNLYNFDLITEGFAVAYKETQNSHSLESINNCIDHALKHDKIVGGWYNSENLTYYYDSVKVFKSEEDALKFAKENDQIAYFNLNLGITVNVK